MEDVTCIVYLWVDFAVSHQVLDLRPVSIAVLLVARAQRLTLRHAQQKIMR